LELQEQKLELNAKRHREQSRYDSQCIYLGEKKLGLLLQKKALLRSEQQTTPHFRVRWTLV
jgi:hypothetical protein